MADESSRIPAGWLAHALPFVGRRIINISGFDTPVEITREQVEQVYLPVLALLNRTTSRPGARVLAGLGGIPGGGKSTFTAVLGELARIVLGEDDFVSIAMDGWHWPNAVLETRTIADADGGTIPLRDRKGGPESFDVAALSACLRGLRTATSDRVVPVYDRRIHEPIARGRVVPARARVLLIEGNFVLHADPPWNEISSQLSPKLFIECDPQAARERIIARHIRGGMASEAAAAKYDRNDRLNIETALQTAAHADVLIRNTPEPSLRLLTH